MGSSHQNTNSNYHSYSYNLDKKGNVNNKNEEKKIHYIQDTVPHEESHFKNQKG